ncbi:hypothetical protein K461DRAFT_296430 [Myriangium duriaei CBS 260.36]|uniref:Uncharacterized protein n=1 Tax=Myriangium duriaei CBS 260.36 TaxID=1168546 RepID=A0A9P4IWC6_9PEZI|nr:hypothetical protein K461DRAFT_296430 [Myriangium duriaei CBS 260.36]
MPGRGGAGNYEAAAAVKKEALQDGDIQAQLLDHASEPSKNPAGYATTGRGGAGNFYTSEQDSGAQDQITEPTSPRDKKSSSDSSATPNVYRGRGGAGNLESAATENRHRDQTSATEVAQRQERIHTNVAKDVEHALARPPRARLPHELPEAS